MIVLSIQLHNNICGDRLNSQDGSIHQGISKVS